MNKQIVVAISGSQGTGKSTLINEISKRRSVDHIVSRKTSRSLLNEWNVTLNEVNSNPLLAMKFQDAILDRKLQDDFSCDEEKYRIVLTERTPVDLFVYTLINLGKYNEYDQWLDAYYNKCVDAVRHYDYIFCLPNNKFKIEEDGIRGLNRHYSDMVTELMDMYHDKMVTPWQWSYIDSIHVEDRADEFSNVLRELRTHELL